MCFLSCESTIPFFVENHFYIVTLENSNDYARMYTKLDKNAINTEYPEFTSNSSNSTVKVVNYFEIEESETVYNLFLFEELLYISHGFNASKILFNALIFSCNKLLFFKI